MTECPVFNAGISRTLAASPNVIQSRGYSDEVSKDPFLATPAPAAEEPSLSFDSPAGSPLSDGFPEPAPKRPEQTGGFNRIDYRNQYPPRNYRTPRGVYKVCTVLLYYVPCLSLRFLDDSRNIFGF